MITETEKLEKEIKMKTLLDIPYDRAELLDSVKPNKIRTKLKGSATINKYGSDIGFNFESIYNKKYNQSVTIAKLLNDSQEHFILSGNPNEQETYTVNMVANGREYRRTFTQNDLYDTSITRFMLNKFKVFQDFGHIPFELDLTIEVERHINKRAREVYFDGVRGGSAESVLDKIFGTKIDENEMHYVKNSRRNSYSTPFGRDSLKGRIYSMSKERAVFLIEYMWGKKLRMNPTNDQLSRFLASAQNKRFGINDVQQAKKLTEELNYGDLNQLKLHLESFGIKPATDMKRWVKRRGLIL